MWWLSTVFKYWGRRVPRLAPGSRRTSPAAAIAAARPCSGPAAGREPPGRGHGAPPGGRGGGDSGRGRGGGGCDRRGGGEGAGAADGVLGLALLLHGPRRQRAGRAGPPPAGAARGATLAPSGRPDVRHDCFDVVLFLCSVCFPLFLEMMRAGRSWGPRGVQVVIEDSFLPLVPKADVAAGVAIATYEQRSELLPAVLQQGGSSGHQRNTYRTFATLRRGMNRQCDTILTNATLVQLMQVGLKPR